MLKSNCPSCKKLFTVDDNSLTKLRNKPGALSSIAVCEHCNSILFFQISRGTIGSSMVIDAYDDRFNNLFSKPVINEAHETYDVLPQFLANLKPDDGPVQVIDHEGLKYFVFMNNEGVNFFFNESQLNNELNLFVDNELSLEERVSWADYRKSINAFSWFESVKNSFKNRKIKKQYDNSLMKLGSSFDELIGTYSMIISSLRTLVSDLDYVITNGSFLNDSFDYFVNDFRSGNSLANYTLSESVATSLKTAISENREVEYKQELSSSLESMISKIMNAHELNDLISFYTLKNNELIKNECIKSFLDESSKFIKFNNLLPREPSMNYVKVHIKNNQVLADEALNELNNLWTNFGIFEFKEISENLLINSSNNQRLKYKVYEPKSKGYTIVDLINSSDVLLFFNNEQSQEDITQAVNNLKTLISDKLLLNHSINELSVKVFGKRSEFDFVNESINNSIDFFNKRINDLSALLWAYREDCVRLKKSPEISDFLDNYKGKLAEQGVSINSIKQLREDFGYYFNEFSLDNSSSKLKKVFGNIAKYYHNSMRKLGMAKNYVINTALGVIASLIGVPPEVIPFCGYAWKLSDAYTQQTLLNSEVSDLGTELSDVQSSRASAVSERDSLIAQHESLSSEADELAADYYAGVVNGDSNEVINMFDTYENAFMGVDEPGFGPEGLDEQAILNDPNHGAYIGNELLTSDVDGVGNEGDPNPFYHAPGTDDDYWNEAQDRGISDILDYFRSLELQGEAVNVQSDINDVNGEISDLDSQASGLEDDISGKNALLAGVLVSIKENSLATIILSAIGAGLLTYKIADSIKSYVKHKREGPLGLPSESQLYELLRTVNGADNHVKLSFKYAGEREYLE